LHLACSKLDCKLDFGGHIPVLLMTEKAKEDPGDERVTCSYCAMRFRAVVLVAFSHLNEAFKDNTQLFAPHGAVWHTQLHE
jgi:hypothetical protein